MSVVLRDAAAVHSTRHKTDSPGSRSGLGGLSGGPEVAGETLRSWPASQVGELSVEMLSGRGVSLRACVESEAERG